MSYILLAALVIALAAIYEFLPNKKFFPYLCAAGLLVFATASFVTKHAGDKDFVDAEEIAKIQERQKIFAEWYAEYQKDIDILDRNWKKYHLLVTAFKQNEINAEKFHAEMTELEKEVLDEQIKIHKLKTPDELDSQSAKHVDSIVKKTQGYVDAQTKTVTMTKAAATPVPEGNPEPETLKNAINEIMLRESPTGLFTAVEIEKVRRELIVPETEGKAR